MTPEKTQATKKPSATCDKCDKTLSSKQSMIRHMKTVHDGIISLKDLFSSPKNLANQKRLFTSVPDLSTQGNSSGQVNDPKVFSEGTFICGSCDQSFITNDEVTNHKSEAHDNVHFQCGVCRKEFISNEEVQKHNDEDHNDTIEKAATAATPTTPAPNTNQEVELELQHEDDFMKDAAEEIEVYEALVDLAENGFNQETEEEKREIMKEKLARYKSIMTKKDKILKATIEQVKSLNLSTETLKHDIAMSAQVEQNKENLINKKENDVKEANNKLKKLENEFKKMKDQNNVNIESLNNTVGALTKRNNDLMTELATQKSLAEVNTVEVTPPTEVSTELEVHNDANVQRVDMSKKSTENKCHACDKTFKAASDLDRHLEDKHKEYECNMCNLKFTSKKQAEEHICMESEVIPQVCDKSYCNKGWVQKKNPANYPLFVDKRLSPPPLIHVGRG